MKTGQKRNKLGARDEFGGTSVGSSGAITQAARIVQDEYANWQDVVVVVSAMSGVTDTLIACAKSAVAGNQETYIDWCTLCRKNTKRSLMN
jgi:aspartokinase